MRSLLFVGTVSNVEKKLEKDILRLSRAASNFTKVSYFLVESDSTDQTILKLSKLSKSFSNFNYISLGNLKKEFPDRIDRIRYCRNVYVKYVKNLDPNALPNYIAVADLDGINSAIVKESLESCFIRDDWDVVLANQPCGYYDIYALRAKNWQESDCFADLQIYKSQIPTYEFNWWNFPKRIRFLLYYDKARNLAIYSKMKKIGVSESWVEVESGFGGLAIYKAELFKKYDYAKDVKSNQESEHVTLHLKLRNDKKRIFINPKFVNSYWNTYNINKFFFIRQIRRLVYESKMLYSIFRKMAR